MFVNNLLAKDGLKPSDVSIVGVGAGAGAVAAMRLLWTRMKQLVEPSSATVLAALLRHRERFAGQRVGVILSGGNVDPDALPALFAGTLSP
jgi:threonine dehydratase